MRICEIASAEDQIALFKLITDKVWQALGDQQRADAEAKVTPPLKAKLKTPTAKKLKPSAARPVPKSTVKAAPSAKPKVQPIRTQPFSQQSQNIQAPSAKQIQSLKRDKDSQSADFDEFDSQQLRTARGKDTHS
jgi:hypothetical protein